MFFRLKKNYLNFRHRHGKTDLKINACFVFIIFISILKINAQENNLTPERKLKIKCPADTIIQWHETIIPNSIFIIDSKQDSIHSYTLEGNSIRFTCPSFDSILLIFSVLPFPFHEPVTLWDSSRIQVAEGDYYYHPIEIKSTNELIESEGLSYDGALTRGFSVGNNQSLVFDSELNLQLAGQIGDGYEIKAAITDNNLPIQPDGTTRQIQEFDKVFIEISKDKHSVLAGDFDAINPPGYFMKYNRKLKGAQYSFAERNTADPWSLNASAAISRGVFTRQSIIPAEGNQGPYPLRGENGELFIIVLAGSERVYLDGRLLSRGEDADYIMDYNQSEITFTRNILINARHRITIEFEYTQFNFQKSHNAFEARFRQNRTTGYVQFFQEKESKSVTGDLQLTQEDISILQTAGDADELFYKSGIRPSPEGFNTNAIFYSRTDTVADGKLYQDILQWSTEPGQDLFTVNFSEVGAGNGDYIISSNPSANGRVYAWISPDPVTGLPRGSFAPIIPLQAPQSKQMLSAGGELPLTKNGKISGEISISNHDLNRYSQINDNDNTGLAIKFQTVHSIHLGNTWSLHPFGEYEGSTQAFRPLDPYRNPEFTRDWNLQQLNPLTREHLPTIGFRLNKGKNIYGQIRYDGLFRGQSYNGTRYTGQLYYDTLGWKANIVLGLLQSSDPTNISQFFRPSFNLEKVVAKKGDWRAGIGYYEDKNEIRSKISDTLLGTSFIQNKLSLYLKNDPSGIMHFYFSYNAEKPKLPAANQFRISERVSEWNTGGHVHGWKILKVDYTIKHREAKVLDAQAEKSSKNLLGRVDMRSDLFNEGLKWAVGYEIGNGQEPKIEYKYIKVQKGEGLFIWLDDGDGIEEINEFEEAPFPDQGEYLRINILNNQFIRTRALQVQQTIHLDLKNVSPGRFLSKIAATSAFQLSRKIREDISSPYWNPFYRQYPDTAILGYSTTLRNILYWNRASTAYDVQLGHVVQKNQVLQTSGYDIRETEDITLRWRISLRKKMDLVFNARKGIRENISQFFVSRNYEISQAEISPEFNIIFRNKFRLTGSYSYLFQENLSGDETFNSHKFSIETVWRKTSASDIRAQINMVNVDHHSSGNMNVDFAMLQGLQDGTNFLWSVQYNSRLNKSLILTLQYNGRKTGDVRTIHTGTAQIRAAF